MAGAALAGWRPRLALTVLGTAIAIGFLLEFGIVFGWPTRLLRLSVFELYGMPLVSSVWWPGLAALIILSTVGFGLAAVTLERRDLGPTSKPIDQEPLRATKHAISHGNQRNEHISRLEPTTVPYVHLQLQDHCHNG